MTKKRKQKNEKNRGHSSDNESVFSIIAPYLAGVVLAAIAVFIMKNAFGVIIVQGDSMNPTFYNGDMVRSQTKLTEKDIGSGDVVTFRYNGDRLIKRVIGVPGDVIAYDDHTIYINGKPEISEYPEIHDGGLLEKGQIRLGKDEYFCLGDNRNNSNDCRFFGPIKFSQIDGKIVGTYVHIGKKHNE